MANHTFERCRREACELLGDAADWLRAGDWPPLTDEQDEGRREAMRLIGEAKVALDRAAR